MAATAPPPQARTLRRSTRHRLPPTPRPLQTLLALALATSVIAAPFSPGSFVATRVGSTTVPYNVASASTNATREWEGETMPSNL